MAQTKEAEERNAMQIENAKGGGCCRKRYRRCCLWWNKISSTYKTIAIVLLCSVLVVASIFIYYSFANASNATQQDTQQQEHIVQTSKSEKLKIMPDYPEVHGPPSPSKLHVFKKAAICSDSIICSRIARDILYRDGTIIDATIAGLLCNGITTMQSMGIGGGFVMNYYRARENEVISINAREEAPGNVRRELYQNNPNYNYGGLSVGIPGEIRGYWELHSRYGNLRWNELVEPTIKICDEGYPLTAHLHDRPSQRTKDLLKQDENFGPFLFNQTTGEMFDIGTWIKPPKNLCNTYRMLAENGGLDLYTGKLSELLLADLQDIGSLITRSDLESYQVRFQPSIPFPIDKHIMYVTPPPTSGVIVGLILNILKGYNFTNDDIATENGTLLTYHRIIEAFKYGFAHRMKLTDPYIIKMDDVLQNLTSPIYAESIRKLINDKYTHNNASHYGEILATNYDNGTSHFSIVAPNGDAIAVTNTINLYFGSLRSGKRTGILFNNGLEDFPVSNMNNYYSVPLTEHNQIQPHARPISSLAPIIIMDKERQVVEYVIGAAGGTRIISALAMAITKLLWFGQDIKQVIDAPRLHHQNDPMICYREYGYLESEIHGLEQFGHKFTKEVLASNICGISINASGIYGNADYRKQGDVMGI